MWATLLKAVIAILFSNPEFKPGEGGLKVRKYKYLKQSDFSSVFSLTALQAYSLYVESTVTIATSLL
jgi:hypothetical protein